MRIAQRLPLETAVVLVVPHLFRRLELVVVVIKPTQMDLLVLVGLAGVAGELDRLTCELITTTEPIRTGLVT
jgi:hypothetical protein